MDKESVIIVFIFFAHLFFTIWALVGFPFSIGYLIYNIFFFQSLLWAVHNYKSSTPLFVSLFLNILSVIMDIILLGIGFTIRDQRGSLFVLSAIAAFINLGLRFVTSFILFRIYEQKRDKDGEVHESFDVVVSTMRGYFAPAQVQPQQQQPPQTQTQPQHPHNNSYPRV